VALSEIDRNLLERCLQRKSRAWEDFVDRFMGLIVHVVVHSAQLRSVALSIDDREDLASDVFLGIIKDDFAVLRHFRGQSSLATYLTVIARRIVVKGLIERQRSAPLHSRSAAASEEPSAPSPIERIESREEIERLLRGLSENEGRILLMYHLEGRSYQEIASLTGVPENTIGSVLSRARSKLRQTVPPSAAVPLSSATQP
jgi:RNA polymerase sigma-70 factor (ECF subfamily)